MGLFNLFGGKKKGETKPTAEPATATASQAGEASVRPAAPVVAGKPPLQIAVAMSKSGAAQVKLRLKLAASLRSGEHAEAYKAAKALAAIQSKAGRRVGARIWTIEAERILAWQDAA